MALAHKRVPLLKCGLNKTASSVLHMYAPCSCGLTWHHHPAPINVETQSQQKDRHRETWWEINCRISRERKQKETKRKCVGEIQTRRWRLLDLLLLEALAFSASACRQDGKWVSSKAGEKRNGCYAWSKLSKTPFACLSLPDSHMCIHFKHSGRVIELLRGKTCWYSP